jgi:hypothetical protein
LHDHESLVQGALKGVSVTSGERAGQVLAAEQGRLAGGGRPRVYVHIGEPKAGTTFLQEAMWRNRARLAAQGVVLPGHYPEDHFRACQDLRDIPRVASDPAASWTGEWEILAGQARRAPEVAIISHELFAACDAGQADRAVRSLLPAEVHIVLTVRDLGTLLPAEWQETVKNRNTLEWERWLGGVIDIESVSATRRQWKFWKVHDTLAILDLWSRHIPPDQVHVVTLPQRGLSEERLWERFASVIGVDPRSVDLSLARSNPSLGVTETEFLRRLNKAIPEEMPDWFYMRNIKEITNRVLGGRAHQRPLLLPTDRRGWAREQGEILVAGLRDAKFDVVGDPGELVPPSSAEPYVRPADLPVDGLLEAAVEAAAALAIGHYRRKFLPKPRRQRQRLGGPRQLVSRLKWSMVTSPRIKHAIREASRFPPVRYLRIIAWRVIERPAHHRDRPGRGSAVA